MRFTDDKMEIRRLVKAGQASHTVSLPKAWLTKNGLHKGDTVYIKERSDTELLITPQLPSEREKKKEIIILSDKKDIKTLRREITSAYINNYGAITIKGKNVDSLSKKIRHIITNFVALEIAEQTSEKITAKDLLNLNEISIDNTIRRIDMMFRSIIKDSYKTLEDKEVYETITFRDNDINRLYFMMVRLLKSALQDSWVAAHFKIKPSEVLGLWYLTINLENMADAATELCKIFEKCKNKEEIKDLKEIYKQIEEIYEMVMKAWYQKDKELADQVAQKRLKIVFACDAFFEKNKNLKAVHIIEHYKDLITCITNISRIVMDYG